MCLPQLISFTDNLADNQNFQAEIQATMQQNTEDHRGTYLKFHVHFYFLD